MAKRGNIFYTDKDFTDSEVLQQFGFPVILILHDNNSVIKKISAFDENGAKSIYDFTLAASKDFVTATIATAISNIKDNTLEFPTFADFPQPGEVGNIYIDLAEDKIYIWDSASSTYISQSWNQTIITSIQTQITSLQNSKLDKGTYTGTADDILNEISEEASFRADADTLLNDGINLAFSQISQKQKKVIVITITGNTTLSEIYNGAVLNITNTCNITIPTGLDANFQCVVFAKGSVIVTFVNSGVTIYAPSGLLLKTDKMASLICTATNNFNLTGELATS